ncbi:MAG: hypothetical protein QOG28_6027, partial [Trebonia sp.]|nr:hypothetical protein [Trebonia sp.]
MNRLPSWVSGLIGLVVLIALWSVLAVTVFSA